MDKGEKRGARELADRPLVRSPVLAMSPPPTFFLNLKAGVVNQPSGIVKAEPLS